MVLTILADGGSGRQCQVTVGNKEIYLEDVEALEFLWKKGDDRRREEVDRPDDDRGKEREREPNLCQCWIYSLLRVSHLNGADITGVQMGGRGGGRGLVARMYTVLNHTSWSKAFEAAAAAAQCVGRGRGERGEERTPTRFLSHLSTDSALMI